MYLSLALTINYLTFYLLFFFLDQIDGEHPDPSLGLDPKVVETYKTYVTSFYFPALVL